MEDLSTTLTRKVGRTMTEENKSLMSAEIAGSKIREILR
jgi:hypothetical protein